MLYVPKRKKGPARIHSAFLRSFRIFPVASSGQLGLGKEAVRLSFGGPAPKLRRIYTAALHAIPAVLVPLASSPGKEFGSELPYLPHPPKGKAGQAAGGAR